MNNLAIYPTPLPATIARQGYFRRFGSDSYAMNKGGTGYVCAARNGNHAKRIARQLRNHVRELCDRIDSLTR